MTRPEKSSWFHDGIQKNELTSFGNEDVIIHREKVDSILLSEISNNLTEIFQNSFLS